MAEFRRKMDRFVINTGKVNGSWSKTLKDTTMIKRLQDFLQPKWADLTAIAAAWGGINEAALLKRYGVKDATADAMVQANFDDKKKAPVQFHGFMDEFMHRKFGA